METVVIKCEGDIVSIKNVARFMSKTEKEIIDMAISLGDKGTFKYLGLDYEVKILKPKKPEPKIVTEKKQRIYNKSEKFESRRKVFISDVVKHKNTRYKHFIYFIDGVETPRCEIAKIVGIGYSTLNRNLSNIKSMSLNGHVITTKIKAKLFKLEKEGKIFDGLTLEQCEKKTKLSRDTIYTLAKEKRRSRKGWRISRCN